MLAALLAPARRQPEGRRRSEDETVPISPRTHVPAEATMDSGRFVTVLVLFGCLAIAAPLYAQTVRVIPAAASCADCSIELELVLTVAEPDAPWLGDRTQFSRDSRGYYYAADFFINPGVVTVVDPGGRASSAFGGAGEGPREGRGTLAPYFDHADTAYVYDFMLSRFSVWAPDRHLVRDFRAPALIEDVIILGPGEMVINANIATRELAGWPLHVLSTRDGEVLRSFGADRPEYRRDLPYLHRRRLASSTGGRFWSAHSTAYVIELWDRTGRKHMELRRDVPWFPAHDGRNRYPSPSPPYTTAVWEDHAGLLWVLVQVQDPEQAAHRDRLEVRDGMRIIHGRDGHRLYDTIVEVLDPATGELLASRRFDESVRKWGSGPLVIYRENAIGIPEYGLYRAILVRGGGSRAESFTLPGGGP
jgi:hypothetical protein